MHDFKKTQYDKRLNWARGCCKSGWINIFGAAQKERRVQKNVYIVSRERSIAFHNICMVELIKDYVYIRRRGRGGWEGERLGVVDKNR
jgi:hypothetical protein